MREGGPSKCVKTLDTEIIHFEGGGIKRETQVGIKYKVLEEVWVAVYNLHHNNKVNTIINSWYSLFP